MKSVFEQNGGTYTKVGDYYLPDLTVPTDKKYNIGKYGRLHERFIKENRPCFYTARMIQGVWLDYLEQVDNAAKNEVERLVKKFADRLDISEKLKATDQMQWVGLINNAKVQAEEFVMKNIVFGGVEM
ncbi:MAG: TnpV protein [Clostridia bacterium]|nr:TnpV protein [Clostridia bacterium]